MAEDATAGTGSRRATTSVLNYALLLVITTTLVAGLFLGVGTLVEDQQERAVASQLETAGNRLAADLGTADRLVGTANTSVESRVRLRVRLPETVAGSEYRIEVTHLGGSRYELVLRSVAPDVERSVVVRSTVGIATPASVSGGRLIVRYDGSQLVVRRA